MPRLVPDPGGRRAGAGPAAQGEPAGEGQREGVQGRAVADPERGVRAAGGVRGE